MDKKTHQILVVDDDDLLRAALCTYLESYGYQTAELTSGEAAVTYFVEHMLQHTIDLVIIDQVMPGMDGITSFQKIHAIDPDLPVIMLTSFSSIDLAIRFMQLGGTNFITKPFAPESGALALSVQEGLNYKRLKQAQIANAQLIRTPASLSKHVTDRSAAKNIPAPSRSNKQPWKVLIISNKQSSHNKTELVLKDFIFDEQPLALHSAYTTDEAKECIDNNPDIALCLLDTDLETKYAGFDMVEYIRTQSANMIVRILLRAGKSDDLPEQKVVFDYEIDGFITNKNQSPQNLTVAVTTALRSYKAILIIEEQRKQIAIQEKRAKQSEQSVLDFLSNLQHETGTGAHLVLSFIEMALASAYKEDKNKTIGHLKKALISAKNLGSYHSDLSLVAHLVAGHIQYDFTEWDIHLAVESACKTISYLADDKHVSIEITGENKLLGIVDHAYLEKALSALLHNAVKFSPPESTVHVSLINTVDHITISIKDRGPGISKDEFKHIFRPFTEGSLTKAPTGGKGFGLTISRYIAEAHSGTLNAENRTGGGAIFTLSLPKQLHKLQ